MTEAQGAAHGLLLQAQAAGSAVLQAGVHYRMLFAWLLTLCRRLGEDTAAVAARKPGFQHDPLAMAAFLKGQFSSDIILPQLDQKVTALSRSYGLEPPEPCIARYTSRFTYKFTWYFFNTTTFWILSWGLQSNHNAQVFIRCCHGLCQANAGYT